MTKYLIEIEDDIWRSFRTVTLLQGIKIKDSIKQAILDYITNHQVNQVKIDIKVIQNNKKNLLTFIYEESIKDLLSAMIQAKKRNAPNTYINDLKKQTLDLLKKHPQLSKDLANEVLTVFRNIT